MLTDIQLRSLENGFSWLRNNKTGFCNPYNSFDINKNFLRNLSHYINANHNYDYAFHALLRLDTQMVYCHLSIYDEPTNSGYAYPLEEVYPSLMADILDAIKNQNYQLVLHDFKKRHKKYLENRALCMSNKIIQAS